MRPNDDAALILWVSNDQLRILFNGVEYDTTLPGRWRKEQTGQRPVAPGDLIRVSEDGENLRPVAILPRKNEFTRKVAGLRQVAQVAAANVDQVLIIASAASPQTSLGLIDRLLVTASIGKAESRLILNKCDLVTNTYIDNFRKIYDRIDIPLHFMSVANGNGIDEIERLLQGKITLLAGQSGVGKSSFINKIHPDLDLRTAEISLQTGKGRHVTTSARLHPLSTGGWIIDTPGLRECAPWGLTRENLLAAFPEIWSNSGDCRFRNCLHKGDDGCSVQQAIQDGKIPSSRYDTYRKLLLEVEKGERKY